MFLKRNLLQMNANGGFLLKLCEELRRRASAASQPAGKCVRLCCRRTWNGQLGF